MPAGSTSSPADALNISGRRLESWKEIAAYLGRDVTTVRRWEKREGLPVHRLLHSKLGSIYAYTAELDAWRQGRAAAAPETPVAALPSEPERATRWPPWRTAIAVTALVLAVAASLTWLARNRDTGAPVGTGAPIRSLAVLPLENFSGDPEQEYLSDGLTEALIGRLSGIHSLRVISRTSVMQFKGKPKHLPAIAKELKVDAVIEGSMQRSGNRIRVSIQLIRASTDEHVWAGVFDRELEDVLDLQSDMAQGIAQQIEVAVTGQERSRLVAARSVSAEVYESYLKGRFALNQHSNAALQRAVTYFGRAIERDPTFAPAHAGLAAAHGVLGTVFFGAPPSATRPKILTAARKALELDPQLAEAHVLLADALRRTWQWTEAEAEYKRALELNGNDVNAHVGYAHWLACQGRPDEAVAWARRARDLDPMALVDVDVGWFLFHARRYDEAIRELRSALAVQPRHPMGLWVLGFAQIGAQRFEEAIQTLEQAVAVSARSPAVMGALADAYARAGRRVDALRVIKELHRRSSTSYMPAAAFVHAYQGLGDDKQALNWLEQAAREQSNILQYLKVHPFFDPLRDDPRFTALVRRVNFPP